MSNEYKAEKGEFFIGFIERIQKNMQSINQTYAICDFKNIKFPIHHDSNIDDLIVIYELKQKLQKSL